VERLDQRPLQRGVADPEFVLRRSARRIGFPGNQRQLGAPAAPLSCAGTMAGRLVAPTAAAIVMRPASCAIDKHARRSLLPVATARR